ncbi:MAG: envelope stress response membrane protein PspC [Desulfobacteraceae bacterium]|uniref:Envelope stress response membrane protein PspC n=1 Tax=Candidatus Desulfacyla euxinica TaxID=2841693 RepID=A0A8J6MZJ6_9DELT|nr:envelope stress response membrane protein PspC [Candidatus Desulfacyla euxinica]MBL6979504.1 envelope stress response membrane protein PspC [Desulfobacteraceae bacterium]MBL7217388.1 envelope stress response membrane protein PspC [Desulfobacteraceae bacterium]
MRDRFEGLFNGGLYRSRNGVILGVCRGIAEYFDFSVFWVRAAAVIVLFISGFWPITAIYFIGAFLMKPEPAIPVQTSEEQEFYDSYVHSRRGATDRLKRRYDSLMRRIQRLEHTVTSKEFDWDQKLNT